jgi:thymidylate synthase complementing protein thyX
MKIIKPKVVQWHCINTVDHIWEHAARCARVCYQSQPFKEGESGKDFLLRTIAKNGFKKDKSSHMSVLEHATVYLRAINNSDNAYLYDRYYSNPYSRVIYDINKIDNIVHICVTTNLRVLVENNWLDDLCFIASDISKHHKRYTFSIITDIGVSRELNRHRCHSISEESTRYCNYSKDKFDNGLTFVIPEWSELEEGIITYDLDKDGNPYNRTYYINNEKYDPMFFNDNHSFQLKNDFLWLVSNKQAESSYLALLKRGQNPQQAREVLPLSLKTQVVHTAFKDDWEDFIALRSNGISGAPHPNIKVIADKINDLIHY